MRIEDFDLKRATIEVRYSKTFLFWDQVGTFWTKMEEKWPNLINTEANPVKTAFRLDLNCSYELVAELEAARIIAHNPKANLDEFKEIARFFFPTLSQLMKIQNFNRIGFRLQHFLKKASFVESIELVKRTNIYHLPSGPVFRLDTKDAWAEIAINLKNENFGVRIRFGPQTRNLKVDPPLGFDLEPINREEHGVLFDIDYFTIASVDIDQIEFLDWISAAHHLIKRDSQPFLREEI
jgi:hypothetical protein